jgi:hypothetical protein
MAMIWSRLRIRSPVSETPDDAELTDERPTLLAELATEASYPDLKPLVSSGSVGSE